jgi:hypothetical protein
VITAVRIVGVALILLGAANLAGMFFIDLSTLINPATVAVRYSLMTVAGLGFVLTYKWAIFVYLGSLTINWIAFFLIYDGQSLGPIWLSFPIPVAITVLTYFTWDKLKPRTSIEVEGRRLTKC